MTAAVNSQNDREFRALNKALYFLSSLLFVFGVAHLTYQVWSHWDFVSLDFRFFWLAGEFWANGETPYAAAFSNRADTLFNIETGALWYYPPSWFPFAVAAAQADPLTGSRIFLIVNCLLVTGASLLNVATFSKLRGNSRLFRHGTLFARSLLALDAKWLFGLHFGFVASMQATGNTLHLGQSSMLIYFGASLLAYGAIRKSVVYGGVGLALALMKPQIGIFLVIALALSAYGRRAITFGALASFILAAPALIITPLPEMFSSIISATGQYNDQPYNLPAAMTGLTHVLWTYTGLAPGALLFFLVCVLTSCYFSLAGFTIRPRLKAVDRIAVSIVAVLAIAPLHIYDFTLIGVLLLIIPGFRPPLGAISLAALLGVWRAGNIPQFRSLTESAMIYYPGSFYVSIAAFALLVATAMVTLRTQKIRSVTAAARHSKAAIA